MSHSPHRSLGLLLLAVLSASAWAEPPRRPQPLTTPPTKWQRSRTVQPAMLQRACQSDGPATYTVLVFRDRSGDIGGYQVSTSIMDSPVHYFDALAAPLTMFHIFGDDAERAAAQRIIKALRTAFPQQEQLPCPQARKPPSGK
jgi:hypothetical protein